MLTTLVVLLVVLWAMGLLTSPTIIGLVYFLAVLALVTTLVRVIQGRRAV